MIFRRLGAAGVLMFACVALFACAEGIAPPRITETVRITTGLELWFGPEEPCKLGSESATEDCQIVGDKDLLLAMPEPQVKLELLPFEIDAHEVTNLQYRYCQEVGNCPKKRTTNGPGLSEDIDYYSTSPLEIHTNFDDFPVVSVTHAQAEAYCKFVNKRLPTEAEWERAARGPSGRKYAAEGMTFLDACKNNIPTAYCQDKSQAALEDAPKWDEAAQKLVKSNSDYVLEGTDKIYHLMGNVAEWTADPHIKSITCDPAPDPAPNCSRCIDCTQAACLNSCKDCDACPYLDPLRPECAYVCSGLPGQSFWCVRRTDTASNAPVRTLVPETEVADSPNDWVIRGSSVLDSSPCQHRSAFRDRGQLTSNDGVYLHVGFRCARSIGSVGGGN